MLALSRPGKREGEAQQATKDRVAAMDALDEWMSDFVAIACIALEEIPQFLEKLGILEPSWNQPTLGDVSQRRLLVLGQPQGLLHLPVQSTLEQKEPVF